MFTKLTEFFDSFVRDGAPGYDCMILQGGREIYRHQSGYTDVENQIPVSGNERYNLYSCSKPITVTAALSLWEEGLYSLDDPLYAILPEFRRMTVKDGDGVHEAKNPIRMRDLFAMTAGFTYDVQSPALMRARAETAGRCPTREVMRYLAEDPLSFEPGTKWQYSLCHDVLAAAVEVLAGERFADYVAKRIFRPLGMTRSTFLLRDGEGDEVTEQYRFDREANVARNCGKTISPYKMGSEYESGGAGCISTVEDYMRFMEGLRTFALLRPETVKLMQTDCLDENTRPTFWHYRKYGYALGVRCPLAGGATDFGWDGAAGSYMAIEQELGLSILYATHMLRHPIEECRLHIIDIVKAAL
ncbi:MAG: beta-lactamase family protein [Clostridia bacterium]|nr:beta-lactamase family protein [Clostridia bacterium]